MNPRYLSTPPAFAFLDEIQHLQVLSGDSPISREFRLEITREIKTSLTAWGADPSTDSATKKQIAAALLTLYAVNPVDLLPATPEMLNGICRNIGSGRADILHRRCFNAVRRFAFENKLTLDGLALSGGGIRSAAICLGVLQALARRGLLSKFQYVSAVSGGGYIASWLSAWAYRDDGGIQGVEQILGQRVAPSGGHGIRGNDPRRDGEEAEPVRWLRRHVLYLPHVSAYLTPTRGDLQSDTYEICCCTCLSWRLCLARSWVFL